MLAFLINLYCLVDCHRLHHLIRILQYHKKSRNSTYSSSLERRECVFVCLISYSKQLWSWRRSYTVSCLVSELHEPHLRVLELRTIFRSFHLHNISPLSQVCFKFVCPFSNYKRKNTHTYIHAHTHRYICTYEACPTSKFRSRTVYRPRRWRERGAPAR
jgi:hypothetical protein